MIWLRCRERGIDFDVGKKGVPAERAKEFLYRREPSNLSPRNQLSNKSPPREPRPRRAMAGGYQLWIEAARAFGYHCSATCAVPGVGAITAKPYAPPIPIKLRRGSLLWTVRSRTISSIPQRRSVMRHLGDKASESKSNNDS